MLLGLVNVWFIELPLLALAPLIEPVFVPNVQANVLDIFEVKLIEVKLPEQILALVVLVIFGTPLNEIFNQLEVSPLLEILLKYFIGIFIVAVPRYAPVSPIIFDTPIMVSEPDCHKYEVAPIILGPLISKETLVDGPQ